MVYWKRAGGEWHKRKLGMGAKLPTLSPTLNTAVVPSSLSLSPSIVDTAGWFIPIPLF